MGCPLTIPAPGITGTYDYFGLNHFTTRLIQKVKPGEEAGLWPIDGASELNMNMISDPTWKASDFDWFPIYPEGLRKLLHWLKAKYNLHEIIILESGLMTKDPTKEDYIRLEYFRDYLEQILLAINEGVFVTGYTAWSLMDSFEWLAGYEVKCGLYAVDFDCPNRTRTPRESSHFYANVAKSRTLNTIKDET